MLREIGEESAFCKTARRAGVTGAGDTAARPLRFFASSVCKGVLSVVMVASMMMLA